MTRDSTTQTDLNALISWLAAWESADFKHLCACFPASHPFISQGSGLKTMAVDLVNWARRQRQVEKLVAAGDD